MEKLLKFKTASLLLVGTVLQWAAFGPSITIKNCLSSTKGIPGVEATVDDPKKCDHPTCAHRDHDPWDSTGLSQLLGGLFGGLLAGVCGGATFLSWRRGRAGGYERLGDGGRPRMEWGRAFFCAFWNRLQRADDGAFLQGDDAEDERQRQAAARRNIAREAAARRLEENRGQDNARQQPPPGPQPPVQDNPAVNAGNQNEAIALSTLS